MAVCSSVPFRPSQMRYRNGAWHVFAADSGGADPEDISGAQLRWRRLAPDTTQQVNNLLGEDERSGVGPKKGGGLTSPVRDAKPKKGGAPTSLDRDDLAARFLQRGWRGSRTGAAIRIQRAQRARTRRKVTRWARGLAAHWQSHSASVIQRAYRQRTQQHDAAVFAILGPGLETGTNHTPSTDSPLEPLPICNGKGPTGVCVVPESIVTAPVVKGAQSAYIHHVSVVRLPTGPTGGRVMPLEPVPPQTVICDSGAGGGGFLVRFPPGG